MKRISNAKIGEAGVQAVVAELLARDLRPYRPVVDDHGVDILLDTGVRIQVKTTTLWHNSRKNPPVRHGTHSGPLYRFTFLNDEERRRRTRKRVDGTSSTNEYWSMNYSAKVDYFVLVGFNDRRFWVVPSFLIDGRRMMVVGPEPCDSMEAAQALVNSGVSSREAARRLGIGRSLVIRWIRQGESNKGKWVRMARQCENRWDLLSCSFVTPVEVSKDINELERILALPTEQSKDSEKIHAI